MSEMKSFIEHFESPRVLPDSMLDGSVPITLLLTLVVFEGNFVRYLCIYFRLKGGDKVHICSPIGYACCIILSSTCMLHVTILVVVVVIFNILIITRTVM